MCREGSAYKLVVIILFSIITSKAVALRRTGVTGITDGFEFEFAINGLLDVDWGPPHIEVAKKLLRAVKHAYQNRGSAIDIEPWERANDRNLQKVVYTAPDGGQWAVVPERVNTTGFDGMELVSAPTPVGLGTARLKAILAEIKAQKLVRRGTRSSTHFSISVSHLSMSERVDLIIFIENHWPEIYRAISPIRYGSPVNRFGIPLAADQQDLLRELSALPEALRTKENIAALFAKYREKERALRDPSGEHPENLWKFRAANYAKAFGLNGTDIPIFEFRVSDLVLSPERIDKIETFFWKLITVTPASIHGIQFETRLGSTPLDYLETSSQLLRLQNKKAYDRFMDKLGLRTPQFSYEVTSQYWTLSKALTGTRLKNAMATGSTVPGTLGWEVEFSPGGRSARLLRTGMEADTDEFPYLSSDVSREIDSGNKEIRSVGGDTDFLEVKNQMLTVKKILGEDLRGFHLHYRVPLAIVDVIPKNQLSAWLALIGDGITAWRLEHYKTWYALLSYSQRRHDPNEPDQRNVLRVSRNEEFGYLDIEVRGFMGAVEELVDFTQRIAAGLASPSLMHTSLKEQRDLRHRRGDGGLLSWMENFAQLNKGRSLKPEEKAVIKQLEEHLIIEDDYHHLHYSQNLPIYHFERLNFLTPQERRKIRDANYEFSKQVWNVVQRQISGEYKDPKETNMQFRDRIRKWSQNVELYKLLKKSILIATSDDVSPRSRTCSIELARVQR